MASSTITVQVKVPVGFSGGEALTVRLPDSRQVNVTIPTGLKAGSVFNVNIPTAVVAPPIVVAQAIPTGTANIPALNIGSIGNVADLPWGPKAKMSLGLVACQVFFGFVAAILTGSEVDHWTPTIFGALALILFFASVPTMYTVSQEYKQARGSRGRPCCMITGWVFYAIGILDGVGLVMMGAMDLYVPPGVIVSTTLWTFASWLWMCADADAARKLA